MSIRKLFNNFKNWCPQPSTPLPTKLKKYYMPIATVVTVTLIFSVSFSLFFPGLMSNLSLPQTIMPLSSLTPANETPPAIAWVKNYTGQENADYASKITQTSDGGYAVIGTIGAHLYSVPAAWLVKIDSQGNIVWNQTFSPIIENLTYNLESVAGFLQTSDGGYAVAGTEAWFPSGNTGMEYATGSEGILLKLDSSGNVEWNQTYPYVDGVSSMVQTSDGGYVLAGDYSLIKTNSLGNSQWHKSYESAVFKPNTLNENLVSVQQTTDGGYALLTSDNILFKVTSSGDLQWKQTYQTGTSNFGGPSYINSFIQTSDSGYLLAGNFYIDNSSNEIASLVKTDNKGTVEWTKTYGPSGASVASLIQTSDGGIAFAGTAPGSGNYPQNLVWLVKTDPTGNLQWSQTNNNTSESLTDYFLGGAFSVNSLIETKDGGFMMAGSWNPGITGHDTAYYLAKTESALPPPTATLTPVASLSPPPQTLNPFYILLIVLGVLVAVIAFVVVTVLIFKKKLKHSGEQK
jgi:hypothetical protein